MPTPVSAARQCLTEEAARTLDDAVAVARRRSHPQTTSLHAVSALLSLPSSALREACARAKSSAFSPRLQFRLLEYTVGVALDRLPSSKAQEEPPVSNSLMAAIKRSQANQRRHPESFHLYQIHNQQQTASLLKVELNHFILSILDDPIVSRVFGEAGFRSCDIKLAIVHPPMTQTTPFPRTRCPPIFLCNLTDSDPTRPGFSFPFSGFEDRDENCRRIGDVLVRKSGKNPLLFGVCAGEALKTFTEAVQKAKAGILPAEITSFSVVSIEKEISEFVVNGGSAEKMDSKFKEVAQMAERCSGAGTGVIVNYGDLKALVGEGVVGDAVSFVVLQLKSLLEAHNGKLWVVGAAASYDVYRMLVARFSAIEKDWDLHLLPITSSKASMEGVYSKSSLMGSFVPFGGFFPGPSDFKNPVSSMYQSFRRCNLCAEKYEQEVASILKAGPTSSATDQSPDSLPSWLRTAEIETCKGVDLAKTKDDKTTWNATLSALEIKWNDICRKNHQAQPSPKVDIYRGGCQVLSADGSRVVADRKENSGEDSGRNGSHSPIQYRCMPMHMPNGFLSQQNIPEQVVSDAENSTLPSKPFVKDSKSQRLELGSTCHSPYPIPNVNLPTDRTSPLSVTSVTTDLGLGTLYASTSLGPRSPRIQDHKESLQLVSGSISAEFDALSENTSHQKAQSSGSGSDIGGQFDPRDMKSLRRVLTEKVGWQNEAICTISQAVSCWRSGDGRNRGSKPRGDIWLTLIGPDRVGKKKIAIALAEILFGTRESLISVDLGSQDRSYQSNSVIQCDDSDDYDVKFRGKTAVDYVAGELSRRPHSVVFLGNVDKADFLSQSNLSQAIRTGKFPDSHGREISINNIVFVTTSATIKGNENHHIGTETLKFSEEMVLAAKRCQMQILNVGTGSQREGMNVMIAPRAGTSNQLSVHKRKLMDSNASEDQASELQKRGNKASRSFLDLNLPVGGEVDESMDSGDFDSDCISENSEVWLDEFLNQVDQKVILKPFDFDALAEKIANEINQEFNKVFVAEVQLEIDFGVMVQILAACWLSDKKKAVEEWVKQVLSRSFVEARHKYQLSAHSVIKLVAGGALSREEQTLGICLPARISLN